MKNSDNKKHVSQPNQKAKAPFFQRKGEGSFFSGKGALVANQGEQPFFSPATIQPKLKIGQPGDKYEQEADAMAEKVVVSQKSEVNLKEEQEIDREEEVQLKPIFESKAESAEDIQAKCAECEQEEQVQKKEGHNEGKNDTGEASASSNLESQLSSSKGGGQSLPEDTRQHMESAFSSDFSQVKVHTSQTAVQMNQDLGAHAFTHGSDIYFNKGKYDTGSNDGQKLLAHELTHVVQQGSSPKIQRHTIQCNCPECTKGKIQRKEVSSSDGIAIGEITSTDEAIQNVVQRQDAEKKKDNSVNQETIDRIIKASNENWELLGRHLARYLVSFPKLVEGILDSVGEWNEDNLSLAIMQNSSDAILKNVKPNLLLRMAKAMYFGWTTDEETVEVKRLIRILGLRKEAMKEEKEKKEADREQKLWYIIKPNSWLRIKAEGANFHPMKSGKVKVKTFLLDATKEYEKTDTEIAAGTKATWYVEPDNSKYAKIFWTGGEGWVSVAALAGNQVQAQPYKRIELLSSEGAPEKGSDDKDYYRVKVDDEEGWTQKENVGSKTFDLTYATAVSEDHKERTLEYDRGRNPNESWKRRRSKKAFDEGAPSAKLSVKSIKNLFQLGYVNNSKAYIRVLNPATKIWEKTAGEDKLDQNIPVIILEEGLYEEQKDDKLTKSWYAKVMDFEGNESWAWAGGEGRGKTKHGNFTLYAKRPFDLPKITNPKVLEALSKVYAEAVDNMLAESSGFSGKQKELFEEAKAFLGDSELHASISDKINYPALKLELEGNKLDPELIRRLDVFYKFLLHKKLIFDQKVTVSDGVRSAAEAHRWSTAYMIQVNAIKFDKIKALTDGKDLDGNLWYDKDKDNAYKDVPLSDEELKKEEEKAKADPKYKKKTTKKVFDKAGTMANIKVRASKFWGTTEAAEGYRRNDPRIAPNHKGQSNHVKGNAVDVTFPFKFNYFDPVIDALALIFGLVRAVKDANSAEYWHYELVGYTPSEEGIEADHPADD